MKGHYLAQRNHPPEERKDMCQNEKTRYPLFRLFFCGVAVHDMTTKRTNEPSHPHRRKKGGSSAGDQFPSYGDSRPLFLHRHHHHHHHHEED